MAKTKSRRLYYRRAFLNKPRQQTIGLVLAEVSVDGDGDLVANLTIGDCSRQMTLDFGCWLGSEPLNRADVANIRHKSALLRQTIGDFLDAVETGLLELEARPAPSRKKKSPRRERSASL